MIERLRSSVLILDAAGLALFAVSGTLKALAAGLNPFAAMLLGVLTGSVAACCAMGALSGAALCFVLRFLAIRRGWRLPVADHPQRRSTDQPDQGAERG